MCALIVPNQGEIELLDKCLRDALSVDENTILKLYTNNYTPDANTAPGSFTEAAFTNYAARTLTRANWNAAVTTSGKAESSYGSSAQSWTCGATGATCYGYWCEGATSAKVLWAEKFATARVLAENDILNLVPKFTLSSES